MDGLVSWGTPVPGARQKVARERVALSLVDGTPPEMILRESLVVADRDHEMIALVRLVPRWMPTQFAIYAKY